MQRSIFKHSFFYLQNEILFNMKLLMEFGFSWRWRRRRREKIIDFISISLQCSTADDVFRIHETTQISQS